MLKRDGGGSERRFGCFVNGGADGGKELRQREFADGGSNITRTNPINLRDYISQISVRVDMATE
jgi:hypothetical protein